MQKLKNIKILATGGTIAGSADDPTKTAGYKAGVFSVDELLDAVSGIRNLANITGEQFAQIDSNAITVEQWISLAKRVNEVLAVGDTDGVVITHGTDTMEETAYFLNLTVKSDKPVVLVGAMRPATALSADGPLNLYNAVIVAAGDESRGKGVVVSFNDKIFAARDVKKCAAYGTDAFSGTDFGCIGTVHNGILRYYYQPLKKHTTNSVFDISDINELPKVEIIQLYGGGDTDSLKFACQKAKGVVIAATGNGSLPQYIKDAIAENDRDTVFVRSSRTLSRTVLHNDNVDNLLGTISSEDLTPQKARILLMLGLTATVDKKEIQGFFQQY